MRKFINLIGRRGRLLIAAPAMVLALGLGAGLTAPSASAGIPGCSWQPLTLMNGWQSEQGAWDTGDPSICVMSNDMVYLSGSLAQPTSGGTEFAVLPSDARPANDVYLSVYTFGDTVGVLRIQPDGDMLAYGGDAHDFTSLASMSYVASGAVEVPMNLLNGWQSGEASWNTGNPAYFVSGGVVHMSGSIADGSPVNGNFAYLPSSLSPTECVQPNVYTYGGATGEVQIQPGGELNAWYGDSTDFTSLAGISYLEAPAAWQQLSLLNGWAGDDDDCVTPGFFYEISGGVVYLDGYLIDNDPGGPAEVAVLPAGARPVHTLYLAVNSYSLTADLIIAPSGAIYLYPATGCPNSLMSLGSISYKTGS
jgi:hypothetical protein